MEEEFGTEQLIEFCQRLGLGLDGYLDEKGLARVCSCIGLQAPEETLKELFEQLDTDKDGRVCLDELSQMLLGMQQKNPQSQSPKKVHDEPCTSSQVKGTIPDFVNGDHTFFSILDPHNSGFTKIGAILDMWSQWGVGSDEGLLILKDMGFPTTSRNTSINVQDLTKALEDETDNAKDALPLAVHTAILTYRTETQYLRSVCESMECERDKLKSDIVEAHQRSSILAQEVDEQNSRLEKNSKTLLHKLEAKYTEQIHEVQQKFLLEKEGLQQALCLAESQLKVLETDDSKLKEQCSKLIEENSALEKEVQSLSKDIQSLQKVRHQLEREIEKYDDVEHKLLEMERRNSEIVAIYETKLEQAHNETQLHRDECDELCAQLESMREKIKVLKTLQERKPSNGSNKRRKGSYTNSGSKSLTLDGSGRVEIDDHDESPLEKMGKFYVHGSDGCGDVTMLSDDTEDLASCHSQPDSGTFPVTQAINLNVFMGESTTDSPLNSIPKEEYGTLEREMETVKTKIENIIVENQSLKSELEKSGLEILERIHAETQTTCSQDMDMENNATKTELAELRETVAQLRIQLDQSQNDKQELQERCTDIESSLDQLREEYEKCEDYWHDKLQEARDLYEQDKQTMDEKFHDLLLKIKEYEETYVASCAPPKLPPIEERASLEQQVTDLEEECDTLRKELTSVKFEKLSTQREIEIRANEECNRLEQQVVALSQKCQEYESRLSSLAEEEKPTLQETQMVEILRERVQHLESQLFEQQQYQQRSFVPSQEHQRPEKPLFGEPQAFPPSTNSSPTSSSQSNASSSPRLHPSQNVWNNNNLNQRENEHDWKEKSKDLLTLLHHQQQNGNQIMEGNGVNPYWVWPQRYAGIPEDNKCASFPYGNPPIPFQGPPMYSEQPVFNNWNYTPNNAVMNPWMCPPGHEKKAWCHVEVGWLDSLRKRLRQREEQCRSLQKALQVKEMETERIIGEIRCRHQAEAASWEQLLRANQDLMRQQAEQCREQAHKLIESETVIKNIWTENSNLKAALTATENRVLQLENILKSMLQQSQTNGFLSPQQNMPRSLPYFH